MYGTNVAGFGGVFQVIDMSAQFSWLMLGSLS